MRRNSLKIDVVPKITEELLCSAPVRRTGSAAIDAVSSSEGPPPCVAHQRARGEGQAARRPDHRQQGPAHLVVEHAVGQQAGAAVVDPCDRRARASLEQRRADGSRQVHERQHVAVAGSVGEDQVAEDEPASDRVGGRRANVRHGSVRGHAHLVERARLGAEPALAATNAGSASRSSTARAGAFPPIPNTSASDVAPSTGSVPVTRRPRRHARAAAGCVPAVSA
jgi:hypothetical protein